MSNEQEHTGSQPASSSAEVQTKGKTTVGELLLYGGGALAIVWTLVTIFRLSVTSMEARIAEAQPANFVEVISSGNNFGLSMCIGIPLLVGLACLAFQVISSARGKRNPNTEDNLAFVASGSLFLAIGLSLYVTVEDDIRAVVVATDRVTIFQGNLLKRVDLPEDVPFSIDEKLVKEEKKRVAIGAQRAAYLGRKLRIGDYQTEYFQSGGESDEKLSNIGTALDAIRLSKFLQQQSSVAGTQGSKESVGTISLQRPTQWLVSEGHEKEQLKKELAESTNQMIERYRGAMPSSSAFGIQELKALRLPNGSGWCLLYRIAMPEQTDYYADMVSESKKKLDWGLSHGLFERVEESGLVKISDQLAMRTITHTKEGGRMIGVTHWDRKNPSDVTLLTIIEDRADKLVKEQVDSVLASVSISPPN